MISKGKRRFLVRIYAMQEFLRKFAHTGHLDVIALAQLAQRNPWRTSLGRSRMTVQPWVMPSLATPETMAKHKEIVDRVIAGLKPNV